jgi:hypothetical protein
LGRTSEVGTLFINSRRGGDSFDADLDLRANVVELASELAVRKKRNHPYDNINISTNYKKDEQTLLLPD